MASAADQPQQPTVTFEGWRYSHYFEMIENKGKNVSVKCTLCPGHKLLSTAVNSTANLTKHLKAKHANVRLVAQDPRGNDDTSSPNPHKQQKLHFHQVSKQELDKLVASFIVEEMLPINTVESPTFRQILSKILVTGDKRPPWPDRRTFTGYLDECYQKMVRELKKTFEGLQCASHTLNLISCNDIDKWLSFSDSKCLYRSATAKCAALWTKASRSTLASEIVDEICGKKMIVPTSARWNSFHDALSRISDIPAQDLNTLCSRLDIRALTEHEHLFLKEYCSVLKPLTIALDILQGDSYYGALLPTLETLMPRTLALQHGLSRMTADLPGVIVQAIKTRFAPVLESREALLAALTLPKFKARWIGAAERKEEARALLIAECRTHTIPHAGAAEQAEKNNQEHSSVNEKDFFSFDEEEEDAMSFSADSETRDGTVSDEIKTEQIHVCPAETKFGTL
ncbi:hypothetical protein ABVT39_013095 [Epinephelus coioides]